MSEQPYKGTDPSWQGPRELFGLLEEIALQQPESEAIVDGSGRRTYMEWLEAAREVAGALAASGVHPGDSVALIMDNRSEWTDIAMGVAARGARLVAFNTWATGQELGYLLEHAASKLVVTRDRVGGNDLIDALSVASGLISQRPAPDVVVLGESGVGDASRYEDWLSRRVPVDPSPMKPDDVSTVLYTSGSTAMPKAVSQTPGALIENGFQIGERLGLTRQDRVLLPAPLFWSYGGANALMATLTHGATLILQSRFDAAEALRLIETEACTTIYTLPTMTHALLDEPSYRTERIRTLQRGLTIGPPSEIRLLAEEMGVEGICNIYGSTEVYGNCCVTPTDAPLSRRASSQGPPLPGVELRIVGADDREPRRPGEVGEIEVRGRVTPGYVQEDGRPLSVVDEEGWFATGDLGLLEPDGWLTLTGRATDMIKSGGINVSPFEVEEVLLGHDDVEEAAVVGVADDVRGEIIVAFVRQREGCDTPPELLREHCRQQLAAYKVPSRFVRVDALPETTTGKVARGELAQLADQESPTDE